MGSKLVSIDSSGVVTTIGDVGAGGPVDMVYSFDHLAIASNKNLWLYDKTTLAQNVDTDLGDVLSVVYLDGYFITTDGENMVVTELGDPFSVNPFKYGSSELDPDNIEAVLEVRNELYAINTNTIEVFNNVGGSGFPFARVEGAQIERGAVGASAAAVMGDALAFVGNGRNEAVGVYLAANGTASKISTAEIDDMLATYENIADVVVEVRLDRTHEFIYIHLPDQTLVFDKGASSAWKTLVWFTLDSGIIPGSQYRARGFVNVYNKWIAGDPTSTSVGAVTEKTSHHFGDLVGWDFSTTFFFNETRGAILWDIELTCLTGEVAIGLDPVISKTYSVDGVTFSQPITAKVGKQGDRSRRVKWQRNGRMNNKRLERFNGTSDAHITIARLDVAFEPLAT
jgi:hypothetical protein